MKATAEVKKRRSDRNWVNGIVIVDDGSKVKYTRLKSCASFGGKHNRRA